MQGFKPIRQAAAGLQHVPCCAGTGLPSHASGTIACAGIRSHGRRCSRFSPVYVCIEAVRAVENSHVYGVS